MICCLLIIINVIFQRKGKKGGKKQPESAKEKGKHNSVPSDGEMDTNRPTNQFMRLDRATQTMNRYDKVSISKTNNINEFDQDYRDADLSTRKKNIHRLSEPVGDI